jgi:hypothetical protein
MMNTCTGQTRHREEIPVNIAMTFESDTAEMSGPETRQQFSITSSSHLAVTTKRHELPAAVAIRTGSFEVDLVSGVGLLTINYDGPSPAILRGVACRHVDPWGQATWVVNGSLRSGAELDPIVVTLRDQSVVGRDSILWWLSGVGRTTTQGRRRGSRRTLVADLMLIAAPAGQGCGRERPAAV